MVTVVILLPAQFVDVRVPVYAVVMENGRLYTLAITPSLGGVIVCVHVPMVTE